MKSMVFILVTIAVCFGSFVKCEIRPMDKRSWYEPIIDDYRNQFLADKKANQTYKRARDGLLTRKPESKK